MAVFLMRDPVERVWSSIRMQVDNGVHGDDPPPTTDIVRRQYDNNGQGIRTRYDRTLAAIEASFDPADVFVEFYERLFDESALLRLTDQIGMDFHAPDLQYRANPSARTDTLAPETARLVANHYRVVYEDVARRFPDVDLESVWPSTRLLEKPSVVDTD